MDISESDSESARHLRVLKAMFGIKDRPCPVCGQVAPLRPASRMCLACYAQRQAEANRVYQRKRRRREKARRRIAAGIVKATGPLTLRIRAECAHCGAGFVPQRSSALYCSPRCRVAAHRKKK